MGFFSNFDNEDWAELIGKVTLIVIAVILLLEVVFGVAEEILKLTLGFDLAEQFPDLLEAIKSRLQR